MQRSRLVLWLAAAILSAVFTPAAAQVSGGISPALIDKLAARELAPAEAALADIVANGNIKDVSLNRQRHTAHTAFINHRIDTGKITNQKGSGRCWMFAGFNVLRPAAIKKYRLEDFEFSQCYLQFWDKLEKSNKFLQEMIDYAPQPLSDRRLEGILDSPLGDGGWWTYFVDLVRKYGVVPKEAMPETFNSSATGMMNYLVGRKVMEMGLALRTLAREGMSRERLARRKEEMLAEVYHMLVLNFGEPPREFVWRYATKDSTAIVTHPQPLTPLEFLEEIIDVDLQDYLALFNYPGKEYDRTYAFEMSRNIYDRPDFSLVNVPIDSIKACALRSILDSTAVWFACDVGRENYRTDGILMRGIYNYDEIYGTAFEMAKKDLIQLGMITPNHAMTFVGVDTLASRAVKWLVENSWGGDNGDDGMWYMYDSWFDRYLFGAIIHRRYLPERLIAISRQDPIVLPPWDPMAGLSRLD